MLKNLYIPILIVFCLLASVANSNDFGVKNSDIKHLKRAIKYIDSKGYTQAAMEAAKASDDDILNLILWMQFQRDYEGNDYSTVSSFINTYPTWPRQNVMINRIEQNLTDDIPAQTILAYFKDSLPVTGHAMRILAEAKIKNGYSDESINELLRKAWVQGDFSLDEEKKFIKDHKNRLRSADHIDRIDRLLWEHKISAAKRVIGLVHHEYKTLFTARIYLIQRKKGVDAIINRINDKLKSNPGLLYDRVDWHLKRRNYRRVYDYLLDANGTMPYQGKWWDVKNRIIRELIEDKEYGKAYKIASNHGNEAGTADFAEAQWLSGWLALSFLNKPNEAYKYFYDMYNNVNFPISKARAAYWAGRAAQKNGNDKISEKWYKLAAQHPTTFYGQIAYEKSYPNQQVRLPDIIEQSNISRLNYKNNRLAKMAYLLIKADKQRMAQWFIKAAIDESKSNEEMLLISQMGFEANQINFSVIAAKQALKKNVVLVEQGWPVLQNKTKLFAEKPIVMAIVRQESLFDTDARSSASAMGLMQLLPSTAKHVSRKLNMRYNRRMLTSSPNYNMQLGSYYINKLINNFDGSYILAIASYNAGPSNVKKWINTYGDPRKLSSAEEVIQWLEHVPFKETRNYIQRVLENIQVYKHIIEGRSLALEEDLMRYNTKLSSN